MAGTTEHEQPDWLIPAVLAIVGAVVALGLILFFVVSSTSHEDDTLAGQMERWTTCLRSEGAPVPLVESVGANGFRLTVDDLVLNAEFDFESLGVAFDECLEDAPDGVQRIADVVGGLSSLPFGSSDLGWLGPLLLDLGDSGLFGDSDMDGSLYGDPPLEELCEQLPDIALLVPDVIDELVELCSSGPGV